MLRPQPGGRHIHILVVPCSCWLQLGLGKVNGDQTIVRMDGSGGKYFVTNSASCNSPITASAYSTTFSYVSTALMAVTVGSMVSEQLLLTN